jgi:hypothetical protein
MSAFIGVFIIALAHCFIPHNENPNHCINPFLAPSNQLRSQSLCKFQEEKFL